MPLATDLATGLGSVGANYGEGWQKAGHNQEKMISLDLSSCGGGFRFGLEVLKFRGIVKRIFYNICDRLRTDTFLFAIWRFKPVS